MGTTGVAAFDVDGTLTRRDCVVPFLLRCRGAAGLAAGLLRHPLALVGGAVRRDRDSLKELGTRAVLAGREVGEIAELGRVFAADVVAKGLRHDTVQRLRWHQAAGDVVVLVSASLEPYLQPFAVELGIDAVLCTRLAIGTDGRYTGFLKGANCRAAEKVVRLRQWLAEQGLDGRTVWAYGDSAGDDQLLAFADHGVRVGREPLPAPDVAA